MLRTGAGRPAAAAGAAVELIPGSTAAIAVYGLNQFGPIFARLELNKYANDVTTPVNPFRT